MLAVCWNFKFLYVQCSIFYCYNAVLKGLICTIWPPIKFIRQQSISRVTAELVNQVSCPASGLDWEIRDRVVSVCIANTGPGQG